MSETKKTIVELLTPSINYFDETYKDYDKVDREDMVDDLMVIIEATLKNETGLITDSELEEIHVNLERTMAMRHHVGGAF